LEISEEAIRYVSGPDLLPAHERAVAQTDQAVDVEVASALVLDGTQRVGVDEVILGPVRRSDVVRAVRPFVVLQDHWG
jgi:hypothetical protein